MANIRRIDLGAPPSSVVPVYQDVYAAGAVGRAAMAVGRGISDVGEAMYNVNQRRQSLAADATYAKFLEGQAALESSIKEYQAKNPTDYDGLAKKTASGQADLVRSVADFAKRQGLEGTRFETVQSRVNANLSELTGNVRASIEKARVLEADEQLANTATLLRNSGKDKEADAAIDSMQSILPSKKEELKKTGRLQGMVVRTRAEINSAQSADELSAVKRQLNAKDANGMYEYSPEMPFNSRMELLEVVDRRNAALTMTKIGESEKEAARIAKESVKNANSYLRTVNDVDAAENLLKAADSSDEAEISQNLSGLSPDLRQTVAKAIASMDDDQRAMFKNAVTSRIDTVTEKQAIQAVSLAASQGMKKLEVSRQIDKGTVLASTVEELHKLGKISAEGRDELLSQLDASVEAFSRSGNELADKLALGLNAVFLKKNGAYDDVKSLDAYVIKDYTELRSQILAPANGMSEEARFRAMQNVAFLQKLDLSDGDIDSSWWSDERLKPDVREWMDAQLNIVIQKSKGSGLGAKEIGNMLFNIVDAGKHLNREEEDAKRSKAISDETKRLGEQGSRERARRAFGF